MTSMRRKHRSFRQAIQVLRERAPTIVPTKVRRVPLKDALGDCVPIYDGSKLSHFLIRIDNRLSWEATWLVLSHEWAHARAWREGDLIDDHDAAFGIEWAFCYRELE